MRETTPGACCVCVWVYVSTHVTVLKLLHEDFIMVYELLSAINKSGNLNNLNNAACDTMSRGNDSTEKRRRVM